MLNFTDPFRPRIYTQRGLVYMDEVLPTDKVFEFNTGKMLDVISTYRHLSSRLFEVKMKDGRSQIIDHGDYLYNVHSFTNCICEVAGIPHKYPYIPCNAYNFGRLKNPRVPYIAAILFVYGDRNTNYVNIKPEYIDKYIETPEWTNEAGIKLGEDGWFVNTYTNDPITWEQFYSNIREISHTTNRIIPDEYFYSSIQDRWKMIRGIFDYGFSINDFPNNIGILHNSIAILNEVKELLLSVGVLSRISEYNNTYRLDVIDGHKFSSEFFYNHDYITHAINMANYYNKPLIELPMIESINPADYTCQYHRAIITQIKTTEKNAVLIGEHFLPRISQ